MAELLAPGVFIQEVPLGPQPIEGVSTSTAGFAGAAERGRVHGAPTLITSFADFEREFGGPSSVLWFAMHGFFDNGGRRAYVVRVAAPDAERASTGALTPGAHVAVASAPRLDTTANSGEIALSSVAGVTLDGGVTLEPLGSGSAFTLDVTEVVAAANLIRFDISGFDADQRAELRLVTGRTHYAAVANTGTALELHVATRDPGDFGPRVGVLLEAVLSETAQVHSETSPGTFAVNSVSAFEVGDSVQLTRGDTAYSDTAHITAIDSSARTVTLAFRDVAMTGGGAIMSKLSWRLTVLFDGNVVERLDGLSGVTNATGRATGLHHDVSRRSRWVRVHDGSVTEDAPLLRPGAGQQPRFARAAPRAMAGGSNGSDIDGIAVIGDDDPRTGLKSLEAQQGISIIAAPGLTGLDGVVEELLAQAERGMDRFAVFEGEAADQGATQVLARRGAFDSRYGAMYYPWVEVLDPVSRGRIAVPPCGHVIGAYARTDNDRGVFKAPASVPVRGIVGFSRVVSEREQEVLNPAGVNALRRLDGLGDVIWGARTISSDSLWRYVPVRRLFIFLEQSIVRGTRFAVFEPNDEKLWARLRDSVTNFLTSQWRSGALFGSTPEEAFFVKVDETTTTQDDRDNGRVNIIIGIAPVKPAEFVVFQIGQAPSSVIVAEQA